MRGLHVKRIIFNGFSVNSRIQVPKCVSVAFYDLGIFFFGTILIYSKTLLKRTLFYILPRKADLHDIFEIHRFKSFQYLRIITYQFEVYWILHNEDINKPQYLHPTSYLQLYFISCTYYIFRSMRFSKIYIL